MKKKEQNQLRDGQFWVALSLLVIITIVSVGNFLRWWNWRFQVGPFASTHWLGWIGAGYIAVITPLYSYLKRHTRGIYKKLLNLHVFGNLAAFLLISIHYTQQAGRPPQFEAPHSTGLALFTVVATMIMTGLLLRFRIISNQFKTWRYIHVSLILSFYIIVIIHVLQYYEAV